jgi:hypothetical protein
MSGWPPIQPTDPHVVPFIQYPSIRTAGNHGSRV